MGAFALDRPAGRLAGADPVGPILAETAARQPWLDAAIDAARSVDERRFRSDGRRERLSATASLLSLAAKATELATPAALTEWRRRMLVWTGRSSLGFPTGTSCTRIEQAPSQSPASSRSETNSGVATRCPPRNKSPPGVSS
jgi:hypothetical protein